MKADLIAKLTTFSCLATGMTWACLSVPVLPPGDGSAAMARHLAWAAAAAQTTATQAGPEKFDTAAQAFDALVTAAAKDDTARMLQILGPDGKDIITTGDATQDKQRATEFAAVAHNRKIVNVNGQAAATRATVLIGDQSWPFPIPLVKTGNKWVFDSKAGREELLLRRIGSNELDAISICRGFVVAQQDYALKPRQGYQVNQYAQRIVSTPGKQDGLAWKNPDGTWGGPVGENIARVIAEGYSSREEPFHGYFFKVLKGQGPDAPLGRMDYVVKGVMIGGFGLVAAPAQYRVTGVKTFIVSNTGVVYQKDFGPATLDNFKQMELFNPDKTWTPVKDEQ